ncbi:TPA: DUF551 domain-containing protein [Enterobacter hormaechei]|nr:DUF551 domain-containing protein [Enterobacter hormaechei]
MSTITKEFTKEQLQQIIETDHVQCGEASALARIALASLEAEPVAYSLIFRNMDGVLNDYVNANTTFSTIEKAQAYGKGGSYVEQNDGSLQWVSDPSLDPVVVPLYTAYPAPVSVPNALPENDDEEGNDIDYMEPSEVYVFGRTAGWNACRAAMLQGAEPVMTAYKLPFEQWLSQQTGTIDVECGCVMTEVFFHWLRVAYEAGNSPVIPDGWIPVSERMPGSQEWVIVFAKWGNQQVLCWDDVANRWTDFEDQSYYADMFTHWMPLPAAPQQEVK